MNGILSGNVGGDLSLVLCLSRIHLMQAWWCSIQVSCPIKCFLLVHLYLDFGDQCSSSPSNYDVRCANVCLVLQICLTDSVEYESVVPYSHMVLG